MRHVLARALLFQSRRVGIAHSVEHHFRALTGIQTPTASDLQSLALHLDQHTKEALHLRHKLACRPVGQHLAIVQRRAHIRHDQALKPRPAQRIVLRAHFKAQCPKHTL